MKLKALKPHYFEGRMRYVGEIYMVDKNYGASAVNRGNCEEIDLPKRPSKKAVKKITKVHPKTIKGKLEKK